LRKARHAPERNKRILELNGKENGSGMSDENAYKIIMKYKDNKEMNEIAQSVYAMNKERLKTIKQDGLESDNFIGMIDNLYDNYVPLRREFRDKDGKLIDMSKNSASSKGFSIGGKEFKKAKGSDKAVESPLINSILASESTIVRSENTETGAVAEHTPEEQVMQVKKDGETYNIEIHDEALASAFKNLNASQQEGLMQFAHKGVRLLASLSTMYNPDFVVS